MLQLLLGLLFLLTFLLIWAATGHGLWLILSSMFGQSGHKTCPECSKQLSETDKACRKCGWTSRAISRTTAMRICTQALTAAFDRGLIDKEALARSTKTISELERSLSGTTAPVPMAGQNVSGPLKVAETQGVTQVDPIVAINGLEPTVARVVCANAVAENHFRCSTGSCDSRLAAAAPCSRPAIPRAAATTWTNQANLGQMAQRVHGRKKHPMGRACGRLAHPLLFNSSRNQFLGAYCFEAMVKVLYLYRHQRRDARFGA